MVAVEAAGVDFEARAAAVAGALDRLARRFVHREEIGAVHLTAGMPKPAARSAMSGADRVAIAGVSP